MDEYAGFKVLARQIHPHLSGGVLLVEADNLVAVQKHTYPWTKGLGVTATITPGLSDEEYVELEESMTSWKLIYFSTETLLGVIDWLVGRMGLAGSCAISNQQISRYDWPIFQEFSILPLILFSGAASIILAASVGDDTGSHESCPDAISQPQVSHLLFRSSPWLWFDCRWQAKAVISSEICPHLMASLVWTWLKLRSLPDSAAARLQRLNDCVAGWKLDHVTAKQHIGGTPLLDAADPCATAHGAALEVGLSPQWGGSRTTNHCCPCRGVHPASTSPTSPSQALWVLEGFRWVPRGHETSHLGYTALSGRVRQMPSTTIRFDQQVKNSDDVVLHQVAHIGTTCSCTERSGGTGGMLIGCVIQILWTPNYSKNLGTSWFNVVTRWIVLLLKSWTSSPRRATQLRFDWRDCPATPGTCVDVHSSLVPQLAQPLDRLSWRSQQPSTESTLWACGAARQAVLSPRG